MQILFRLLKDFRIFQWDRKYYFMLFSWIFVSAITIAEPIFFSRILNVVEDFIKTNNFDNATFIEYIIVWILFIVISVILQYIHRYYIVDRPILWFYRNIVIKYSKVALETSYWSYLGKKQGETFKRLDRGKGHAINLLFFLFLDLLKQFSGIFFIVIFMLFINVKMTLITLSLFPVAIFIGVFFNKKTYTLQKKNNDEEDKIFWLLWDWLTNFGLLKILGLEPKIFSQFRASTDILLDNQYSISKRWSIAQLYIWVLVAIMRLIVLVVWVYMMKAGNLSLAELFLFFSYIGWIYFPLWHIFGQLRNVQEQVSWVGKMYEEFEDDIDIEEHEAWKTLEQVSGNIQFKNVWFGYSTDKKILQDININIQKGQKIALVWSTWSWKSTLVNLFLRFWDATDGVISLDWHDITKLKKSFLRSKIWMVSQDNSLFNMSIKDNLLFAKEGATDDEITQALKDAEASFVFDFTDGIDTVIWERWLKLSWWEKQRLSIARLFLKNPSILVLDEATSALDNATEKMIQKSLEKLMVWKTAIIIAHRLSTIQHVDNICMLENGKIVEQGSYKELMRKKSKFFSLANPEHMMIH